MKRKFTNTVLVCAILICTGCGSQSTPATGQMDVRAKAVETASNQQLGISINALSLLLDAAPGTVYPTNGADIQSRREALNELEKNGFIDVKQVDSADGGFLVVERTQKGKSVADVLLNY